jgi:cardiolipin synthase
MTLEPTLFMEVVLVLSYVALAVGCAFAALMVARVNREQRSPAGTIAWLLVIVLLPYVGVPLYLFLGGRKMRRAVSKKPGIRLQERAAGLPEDMDPLKRLFRGTGLPAVSVGNRVTLCGTGEEAYRELISLIRRARRRIYLTTFLLSPDEVGREVVRELAAKARKGVDVRLVLDAVGSAPARKGLLKPLLEAGGKAAWFMPVMPLPFRRFSQLRNHRKMLVVDSCHAMAGGANIAREYMGPAPIKGRWRDLMFVLEGPAARDYEEIFREDWEFASGGSLSPGDTGREVCSGPYPGAVAQVLPSGPDVEGDFLYDTLLSLLFWADQRLWIVTPYFVPDEALQKGILIAVRRGVDVRVIVPERSNHSLVDVARRQFLREIQEAGGKVLYYKEGMLHAKVMLVDNDVAVMGSANLDMRSLLLNYEVVLLAYGSAEVGAVASWMEDLELTERPRAETVSVWRDFGEGLVRMLAPLL